MNEFKQKAEVLISTIPPLEERKKQIEELNEECYQKLGKFLSSDILNMLGDWLLHEYHSDKTPNKADLTEYPILSKYQIKRRSRKLVLIGEEDSLSMVSYHLKNNSTIRKEKGANAYE